LVVQFNFNIGEKEMARRYAITGSVTTPNSATLPIMNILSTTAIRPKIYDVLMSSGSTPADNVGTFKFQRCTTAGTAGSNPTPNALDPGDPSPAAVIGLAIFSVGPTLTANAFVHSFSMNQRATVRWVASPGGEWVMPATANYGLALMNTARNSDFTVDFTIAWEE
jgi:hypothetical protein